MRKSKFTECQIVATLKHVEGGRQVKDVYSRAWHVRGDVLRVDVEVRWHEGSRRAAIARCRGGARQVERMYAELAMESHALKDLIAKEL